MRAAEQPYLAGSAIDYSAVLARAQNWSLSEAASYLERKRLELSDTGLHVDIDSHLGDAASLIEAGVQVHQACLVVMASAWTERAGTSPVGQRSYELTQSTGGADFTGTTSPGRRGLR